jgi:MerR HTH family regulatory protein
VSKHRQIICADCGRKRPHHSRLLCSSCYHRHHRKGTLDQWPLTDALPPELNPLAAGITYRQLDHWTKRGYLHAENPSPGSGRKRRWSEGEKQVAALMLRLISAGLTVEAASAVARSGTGVHHLAPSIWIAVDC